MHVGRAAQASAREEADREGGPRGARQPRAGGQDLRVFPGEVREPEPPVRAGRAARGAPDALVVQTHLAPRAAIASACSLAAHATPGWSRTFAGDVIGRDQLELWARGLDHFMADPVGPIESVYGHFGLALSGAAANAMRAVQAGSAPGGAAGTGGTAGSAGRTAVPAHQYALADFGLTGGQVDERFAGYLR